MNEGRSTAVKEKESAAGAAGGRLLCAVFAVFLFTCTLLGWDSLLRLDVLPAACLAGFCAALLPVLAGKNRFSLGFCAALALLCALLFAGPLREGFLALCRQLFSVSEAHNRYTYAVLELSSRAESLLPAVRILLAAFWGALCAAAAQLPGRRMLLLLPLFFACFEAYFGIVPASGLLQVFLLGAPLAMFAVKGREGLNPFHALLVLAVLLLAFGGITALSPGVDEALEARSEKARDALSRLEAPPQDMPVSLEAPQTHHESRYSETEGDAAEDAQAFAREEKPRESISLPQRFRAQPILLIVLEIAALLLLPFLPFYFVNRARAGRQAKASVFLGEDRSAAICGMMDQIVDSLSALGLSPGNQSNAELAEETKALASEDFAKRFEACALLQQEAAYSCHAMGEDARQELLSLLRETESLLAQKLDLRRRVLAKYRDGLFIGV
ncbi:MAG: hypothetical protein K5981_09785 [Clostridia bacterium]|nr:hypothetical protein [Clostridia bacterium]